MDSVQDLVVRAASAGNRPERIKAYAELVTRFRDMACGYAYSILGDFHQAEDAAQDAFVMAFERIEQLQTPAAFGGWLRRIVGSACQRMTRRRQLATAPLQAACEARSPLRGPAQSAETAEETRQVLAAIDCLPPREREVILLFHLGQHSLHEVASFLGVPITTVKNRLHAGRAQLKGRVPSMVENTLHRRAAGDGFDRGVVERLLAQPDLTVVAGHPIREIYQTIRTALPDYDEVRGEELVSDESLVNPWMRQFAVPAASGKLLRPETTTVTFAALAGRTPPVRLITAGRLFRGAYQDRTDRRVYHGMDLVCVAQGVGQSEMKATVAKFIAAIFGAGAVRYEATTLPSLSPCYKIEADIGREWRGVAGCGVLKAEYLRQRGFAQDIGGFAIAAELENLAAIRQTLNDLR
jgi:RNA polymerase sigma-70 factor (ECF subfamily)